MKSLLISVLLLVSASSFAAKQYGEAGCGLGSMLMGKNGNQVLAATTNGSSYTQYFGITSGTSNCVDSGSVKEAKQIPLFIEANKDMIAKEAARGEGETLSGLAHLYGCESKAFGSALKGNYKKVFVESGMQPLQIESEIKTLIQTQKAQACGA